MVSKPQRSAIRLKLEKEFLNSLNHENLFHEVSDCLVVIFTSPDALKYPATFSRLLPYVLQLEAMLDQCLIADDKVKRYSFIFLYSLEV